MYSCMLVPSCCRVLKASVELAAILSHTAQGSPRHAATRRRGTTHTDLCCRAAPFKLPTPAQPQRPHWSTLTLGSTLTQSRLVLAAATFIQNRSATRTAPAQQVGLYTPYFPATRPPAPKAAPPSRGESRPCPKPPGSHRERHLGTSRRREDTSPRVTFENLARGCVLGAYTHIHTFTHNTHTYTTHILLWIAQ